MKSGETFGATRGAEIAAAQGPMLGRAEQKACARQRMSGGRWGQSLRPPERRQATGAAVWRRRCERDSDAVWGCLTESGDGGTTRTLTANTKMMAGWPVRSRMWVACTKDEPKVCLVRFAVSFALSGVMLLLSGSTRKRST